MTFCIKVKPGEIVKVGTVFALYGEQGELIIANRDKAVVEAALRAHRVGPKIEEEDNSEDEQEKESLPSLDDLSYRELKAIAKEQEVPRYQRMKRDDLQVAIEKLMASAEDSSECQGKSKPPPDYEG